MVTVGELYQSGDPAAMSSTAQGMMGLTRFDGHPSSGVYPPEGCPIMESMGKKPRRRRSFTAEFKAEIELCQRGGPVR